MASPARSLDSRPTRAVDPDGVFLHSLRLSGPYVVDIGAIRYTGVQIVLSCTAAFVSLADADRRFVRHGSHHAATPAQELMIQHLTRSIAVVALIAASAFAQLNGRLT